jgi:hypothetical protein
VCHCEALARRDISGGVTAPRWTSPIAIKATSSASRSGGAASTNTPDKTSASQPSTPQTNITSTANSKSETKKEGV